MLAMTMASTEQTFNVSDHLATQSINPQTSSPLLHTIPPEIRNRIFEYALSEHRSPKYPPPDFTVRYDHEDAPLPNIPATMPEPTQPATSQAYHPIHGPFVRMRRRPITLISDTGCDWERPEGSVRMITDTTLLLTCRKIYLETCALPLMLKEHKFWCFRGPAGEAGNRFGDRLGGNLRKPGPIAGLLQRDLMRYARFYTQLFWLEDQNNAEAFWKLASAGDLLKPVEHLRITIRRSDWWLWENGEPLKINPFRGTADVTAMNEDIASGNQEFQTNDVWGLAFRELPNLKTLRIDFETSEDKREELNTIVEWATTWRLPLRDGRCLSTAGEKVEKMSWRGRSYHWDNDFCRECRSRMVPGMPRPPTTTCATCIQKELYKAHGYGPRLYVWTVTWKSAAEEQPERL